MKCSHSSGFVFIDFEHLILSSVLPVVSPVLDMTMSSVYDKSLRHTIRVHWSLLVFLVDLVLVNTLLRRMSNVLCWGRTSLSNSDAKFSLLYAYFHQYWSSQLSWIMPQLNKPASDTRQTVASPKQTVTLCTSSTN